MSAGDEGPIIFFDGECSFCSFWVRFVLRWEKRALFRFCASQSNEASARLSSEELALTPNTVVLKWNGKTYVRSQAVLLVLRELRWFWPLGYVGRLVPLRLRDWAYAVVARHRHNLSPAACPLPSDRARFLG